MCLCLFVLFVCRMVYVVVACGCVFYVCLTCVCSRVGFMMMHVYFVCCVLVVMGDCLFPYGGCLFCVVYLFV